MRPVRVRRWIGGMLVVAALLLLGIVVGAYIKQPDLLAAFTVLPIWVWGGVGLGISGLTFFFLRARLALGLTALWALTILLGADETASLTRIGHPAPAPGEPAPYRGKETIRVVTLNRSYGRFGNSSAEVVAYRPDIVLFQECLPFRAVDLKRALFGDGGDIRSHRELSVISRWNIVHEVRTSRFPYYQVTIRLPDGREIEVGNAHLSSATTNLRWWEPDTWREHRDNRRRRRREIGIILETLRKTTPFPDRPTLLAGDFNAPAHDVVYDPLERDLVNSFSAAGTGWGNTFHRRLPVLRIDHIFATPHFTPVRSAAVTTRHSDHRMVVSDLVLEP